MSMLESPVNGYVVEARKLILAIMPDAREKFQELLNENDDFELSDFIQENLMPGMPVPTSVYTLSDEDTAGKDMELGETYVIFDEDVLYELVVKSSTELLQTQIGEVPKEQNWIVYG